MMRRLALAAALVAGAAQAQEAATEKFGSLHRFDDDVSAYADSARWREPWDPLKYIELGGARLSLGGELREKFESERQPGFGLDGLANESVLLHRLLLHADLKFDSGPRLFVQLGNQVQTGRRLGPGPTDVDRADVQQAFLELPVGDALRLRVGRQEIAFGAQRFVSVRESPNVRQSFDGVRATVGLGAVSLDLFATRPYRVRPGAFDDGFNDRQVFWGAYASWQAAPGWTIDFYHLGLRTEQVRLEAGRGVENRLAFGARVAGRFGRFDLDADAMLQGGTFAGHDVRAFAVSSDMGYRLDGAWAPRLGLKTYIASGDSDPTHGDVGTFNPFFPKGAYFTEAAINAAANLISVGPTFTVQPTADLTLSLSWDRMWRYSRHDAFYAQPFVLAVPGNVSTARDLGNQVQLLATQRLSPNLTLGFAYVRFEAGQFLKDAGGKSLDHVSAWFQFRF